MDFKPIMVNYGPGCAGAHGVLLVDGWEGLRAKAEGNQGRLVEFNPETPSMAADAVALYKQSWTDAICSLRRTSLCEDAGFWLVEDLIAFEKEREVCARWLLRPGLKEAARGVEIETAEGVGFKLVPLLGPDNPKTKEVAGFPDRLDVACVKADFHQKGNVCRWLWLALPFKTRSEKEDLSDGWTALADRNSEFSFEDASKLFESEGFESSLSKPPFLLGEAPLARRWWYRKTIRRPGPGRFWLRLPKGLIAPEAWLDGKPCGLAAKAKLAELMPLDLEIPAGPGESVSVALRSDCGASQYCKGEHGTGSFCGRTKLVLEEPPPGRLVASYAKGRVEGSFNGKSWSLPYELMRQELGR
jgi:hypothetical protein